jgi:hypothetical protein
MPLKGRIREPWGTLIGDDVNISAEEGRPFIGTRLPDFGTSVDVVEREVKGCRSRDETK